MRKKGVAASVWLNTKEQERYQAMADARGITLSALFKESMEKAASTVDATVSLKALAADQRADTSRVLDRILESDALHAQERARFLDELRQVFGNFLADLKESQREAVKEAFLFGQKNPTGTQPRKPTDHELGIHRPPTPRS